MIFYGNQASDAELVVLYGNCQIPFLARLLAAARDDKGYLCVLNHAPPGQEPERPTADQMRRCTLYLEQYDSQPDMPAWKPVPDIHRHGAPLRRFLREACPPGCPKIVFPGFVMTCFWPFATIGDPRTVSEPGYVWGRYPYGNRVALEVVASGLTGPAALAAYTKRSAECLPDPQRTLETAWRKLAKRDAHCDVKIADYVWANFRERHMFLSYGHLRGDALGVLAGRLYDVMHPLIGGDGTAARQRLRTAASVLPDMDALEEPIDPLVAEGLGLKFYTPGMRFRWYDQYWTFEEYMARYLAYDVSW
ncbi:WcbI family polysaccharide biosynthesis putative acetyltransferase [Novispirillum sp. DQ9]|uniref:WcbI family polysaccharide biosynthesis putative acetyltransferase n=1 Tax=Novispirillum sp. DQ9 TaxID=3398612 RepID=UPI003C7C38CE